MLEVFQTLSLSILATTSPRPGVSQVVGRHGDADREEILELAR